MKQKLIYDSGSRDRAVLLMAGWGMDPRPFSGLSAPGYDIVLAWDYASPDDRPDMDALREYGEIVVVAWSFGVAIAAGFLRSLRAELPVTAAIAVNGTPWPVDDTRGIPRAIFSGTLDGLSERTLDKFNLRMAGNRDLWMRFSETAPARTIDSLRRELAVFAALKPETNLKLWDTVFIADDDRIVPTASQLCAWAAHPDIRRIEGAHLPDFGSIIATCVVNKQLVCRRFGRSKLTYEETACVQREVAAELLRKLERVANIGGAEILEIGCGTGMLTRLIATVGNPARLLLWDIASLPDTAGVASAEPAVCDAETAIALLPECSLDVIVSASTVQWFNSLAAFLRQCGRVLRPGGVVALSTFGPETFASLREFSPSPLRLRDQWQLQALVPDGMEIVAVETTHRQLRFPDPMEMLRHIKASGVNSTVTAGPATVGRVVRDYPRDPDGGVTLVYEPQYMILKKKL